MKDVRFDRVRYLLIQIRNVADPMRRQEIECFAWALDCDPQQIHAFDLLSGLPTPAVLHQFDVVLIGGAGEYSTTKDSAWLDGVLDALREMAGQQVPVFGSCWGFQAIAKAHGGCVINDVTQAELGTIDITLTEHGKHDPVFGSRPGRFKVFMGHEDIVVRLPPNATLLASSEQVAHQAFRLIDSPCYATQFHPELYREPYMARVRAYPQYVSRILGMSVQEFDERCLEIPHNKELLTNFVREVLQ